MGARDIHVMVGIPSGDTWKAQTAKCVALMFSFFALHPVKGARTQKMSLLSLQSSMLSFSRETIVKKALQSDATHLLFIDSDMVFPMETANRLLSHQAPFVAANCTTRKFPTEAVAHTMEGERLVSLGKSGLEVVQHTGLAMALIECSVLKKLTQPLFLMDWVPALKAYCGEDVYFCQKLAEQGIRLYIDQDLSVKVKHVGSYLYGHEDIKDGENPE